jgi:TolA-binding protein
MSRLDSLFREIADEQDALRECAPSTERLVERIRVGRSSRRRIRRAWLLAAAAVVVIALGSFVVAFRRSELAVTVGNGGETPLLGAWLGAPEHRPLSLEFSDGSRFELAPGSKARLVELERTGARVELANGKVKVHVVHREAANFRLEAGPYRVRVTGTRFESSYSPERDVFELFLEEGQVELSGCVFGKGRKLTTGQGVRASCSERTLDIGYGIPGRDRRAEPAPKPAAAPAASSGSAPSVAETARDGAPSEGPPAASASTRPLAETSWLPLARAGDYDGAFSSVRARGFEAECARASADSLALLADVARHARAPKQAEFALLTLRRRFPGTSEAALAAFALGRLEFDERRAYARAATWFSTYLSERPSGPMAREALGRLVEARYRGQDLAGARTVAAQYLREYPTGPHAELASRVVSSP